MKRIGLKPGGPFDFAKAPPQVQKALQKAVPIALKKITEGLAGGVYRFLWTL